MKINCACDIQFFVYGISRKASMYMKVTKFRKKCFFKQELFQTAVSSVIDDLTDETADK